MPALRQKYLFSNFEQSSANRKYKDSIPTYLHNRPKAVILHCLDRKASSSKFGPEDVSETADEGIFKVKSGDNTYVVNFKHPSCSCPDWTETNYPCKHFFAVFRIYPTWEWNTLPLTYLESPRLSLDKQALHDYFCSDDPIQSAQDTSTSIVHMDTSIVDGNEEDFTANIPKRKVLKLITNANIVLVIMLITCTEY